MMKKMLFLMLFLMLLGIVKVNAQVRIGGNSQPQGAAVLDLNADNSATPVQKGGLALPRVNLADRVAYLNGTKPVNGTLVYNTNTSLGVGVCYFQDSIWVRLPLGTLGTVISKDTLSFKSNPETVTWTLVLDTVLTNTMYPGQTYYVHVKGTSDAELRRIYCRLWGSPSREVVYNFATQSLVILWNADRIGVGEPLKCYRASK